VESPAEITLNTPFVASLLYSSLLGTAVAWLLWLGLVRAGEASRVSAYIFFVPLVAVLIGAIFLDETLSPSLLVGAVLVVAGIYLANGQPSADSSQPSSKGKKHAS
jgi:O-acetylserine/cysteine efflux transporter